MDEAAVFGRVANWLDERDYRLFVHVPSHYHDHSEYGAVIEKWPTHDITISGYRPDILGFTPTDRVFAIEVKGGTDIRKGFGQAASYRRGVDHAYLAAHHDAVRGLADVVHANGVGVFAVDGASVTTTHPHTIDMRDQLSNTRRQLESKLSSPDQRSTFIPNYVDPLNNLLPVVAIAGHGCTTKVKMSELCDRTGFPYSSEIGRMIRLAQNLGLTSMNEPFELTSQGELGWLVLQGSGIETANDLIDAKDESGGYGPSLTETRSAVATFLRNRFAAVPAYRTLFEVLLRHPDSAITLQDLSERLLTNYPSTFFNIAYSNRGDDRDASRLLEEGRIDEIVEDTAYLARILNTNFTFNLPGQLKTIGVLGEGTTTVDRKQDIAPETDEWIVERFSLA